MRKPIVALRNFANEIKNPCSLPKKGPSQQTVYGSVQCSVKCCIETDSIQLTAVTGTDGLPQSQ